MSDSRLEKFIYAICSMDVSDLPVPLSRIETLWNCLITGETPDFEPLSRNEKYLMAMLDHYDISNLPAPMSRGEKLLYKIAVGETDLSDVPGYLSRYEELLKYLIENGGISGGDFEYVLYTLNQSLSTLYTTAEKPVKSAILKGQTLVNLAPNSKVMFQKAWAPIGSVCSSRPQNNRCCMEVDVKPNTIYTIYSKSETYIRESKKDYTVTKNEDVFTNGVRLITTLSETTKLLISFRKDSADTIYTEFEESYGNVVIEGDYTNVDIPYFEGMQSVKMPVLTTTGKNLFDINFINTIYSNFNNNATVKIDNNSFTMTSSANNRSYLFQNKPIILKPNTVYTLSLTGYSTGDYRRINISSSIGVDKNDYRAISLETNEATYSIQFRTNKSGHVYINFYPTTSAESLTTISNIQLEEGSAATPYEPYKSNILSTSEDVTLRGIDDVKDELNLLTGELTQKVNEIVLDGSENWTIWNTATLGDNIFGVVFTPTVSGKYSEFLCDKLPALNNGYGGLNTEYIYFAPSGRMALGLSKNSVNSISDVVDRLSQNPITVQYQLATESVKTVDLTVVDQDNQPTQLGTFKNVTHVSLESAGLIPEVEMEVATNLLEDTVFTLTDAFNTLYPTAAKPVVDGKLTGQTLVNVANYSKLTIAPTNSIDLETGIITMNGIDDFSNVWIGYHQIKPSTKYLCLLKILETNGNIPYFQVVSSSQTQVVFDESWKLEHPTKGLYKKIITTSSNIIEDSPIFRSYVESGSNGSTIKYQIMGIEYQDGMENWDIPYFEGMQSVKMPILTTTGKNLFDKSQTPEQSGWGDNVKKANVKENTTYVYSSSPYTGYVTINFYNNSDNKISGISITSGTSFTTPPNTSYLKTHTDNNSLVQIEEGTQETSYEPYKSSILSCNEEVTLRGIGEVRDEVNVMTGEVVERIGEAVLNGSENWAVGSGLDANSIPFFELSIKNRKPNDKIICDKLIVRKDIAGEKIAISTTIFGIMGTASTFIRIKNGLTSLTEFKEWLSQNPVTVQYQLATPTTKTVDLSIVNQDGNETKLRTFDDTTHVLLQSEAGPNPGASLTVRTKIPSASSTSLLMDDISTNQQQLEATVDEQSNNVDATMIATTEIYEETL